MVTVNVVPIYLNTSPKITSPCSRVMQAGGGTAHCCHPGRGTVIKMLFPAKVP